MNGSIEVRMRAVDALVIGAAVVGLGLSAQAIPVPPEGVKTLYGDFSPKSNVGWYADAGCTESASWENGCFARIMKNYSGNGNLGNVDRSFWGVTFEFAGNTSAWTDGSYWRFGAGGITFTRDGNFTVARGNTTDMRFFITADQTWSGHSDPSYGYANLSIGYLGYSNYWLMPLSVGSGVQNLTIREKLNAWFCSSANNLSAVDVRVEAPARLCLPYSYLLTTTATSLSVSDGRLHARKLTLSGDGDQCLPVGGTLDYYNHEGYSTFYPLSPNMNAMVDEAHIASTLELNDGADLTASSDATFAIPNVIVSGSGESVISGPFAFTQASTAVTLADGATLRLGDGLTESGVSAALSVAGTGTLVIENPDQFGLTGEISLGEGVKLALDCSGRVTIPSSVSAVSALSLAVDGIAYLPTSLIEARGLTAVEVTAGTLYLDGRRDGFTVTTSGSGAVVYATDDPTLVTDTPVTTTSLVIGSGDSVKVIGNGLTSATALTLNGGSGLEFLMSATIASPVTVSATSYVLAAADVTGTFSGALTVNDGVSLKTGGEGTLVFAGGGNFSGNGSFVVLGNSSAVFTNGEYRFEAGTCGTSFEGTQWGRYLGVRDGGTLTFVENMKGAVITRLYVNPLKHTSLYNNSATLEVGVGGTVNIPGNAALQIGANQSTGYFLLSGGEVTVSKYARIHLGYGDYSTGIFKFSAGTFTTSSPFVAFASGGVYHTLDNALVEWTGGTWKVGSQYDLYDSFLLGVAEGDGTRRFALGVLGDCTLDLTDMPRAAITNVAETTNRGEWYGNGKLTVKGGKTIVMQSFPNDIDLTVEGDGTKVVIDEAARVFDYAKCAANCTWRKPYPKALADYSSAPAECADVTLRSLTVKGDASFVNQKADRTVAVTAATVAAGGVWDNASTVSSALRTFGPLTFEEGALWRTTYVDRQTPSISLTGPLTLASALNYTVTGGGPGSPSLITATEIVGDPVWTVVGHGRGSTPVISGNCLGIERNGLVITLR